MRRIHRYRSSGRRKKWFEESLEGELPRLSIREWVVADIMYTETHIQEPNSSMYTMSVKWILGNHEHIVRDGRRFKKLDGAA